MKEILAKTLGLFVCFAGMALLAQDVATVVSAEGPVLTFQTLGGETLTATVAPTTWAAFIQFLIASLGGLKGAGAVSIAYAAAQILMRLLNTPLGQTLGIYRLLCWNAVALAAGVLGLMVSGVPLLPALLHAQTMAMAGVFIDQIFKQVRKVRDEKTQVVGK